MSKWFRPRNTLYTNVVSPQAPNPKYAIYQRHNPFTECPTSGKVTITLSEAEWISIRAALGLAAEKEQGIADRVKDRMLKFETERSADQLRALDRKIESAMGYSA